MSHFRIFQRLLGKMLLYQNHILIYFHWLIAQTQLLLIKICSIHIQSIITSRLEKIMIFNILIFNRLKLDNASSISLCIVRHFLIWDIPAFDSNVKFAPIHFKLSKIRQEYRCQTASPSATPYIYISLWFITWYLSWNNSWVPNSSSASSQ